MKYDPKAVYHLRVMKDAYNAQTVLTTNDAKLAYASLKSIKRQKLYHSVYLCNTYNNQVFS